MNQYPGTNYHDLNLDWLMQQMKACLAEWTETKEDWQELETDNTEFKTYVTNYLQNLDISEEIAANFAAFVASGEFLTLITADPTGEGSALSDAVSTWMNAHITQETGYVLDDSLTEPTMAAQAKATGDAITEVKSALPSIANKFYTIIPNNTDYDTLLTPGTYLCTAATSAQTMTHAPSALAHKMYVITTTAGNKLYQLAFTNDTGASCYKRYYNASTWTAWKKFAITDDIPTAQVSQNTTDIASLLASTPSINNTRYTIIPDNTDYDTLLTPGTYLCTSATAAQTMTHAPSALAHKMYVFTTTGGDRLFQLAFANSAASQIYKRYYNGTRWNSWLEVLSDTQTYRVLILGDSYSEQGRWVDSLQNYIKTTSVLNLGVSSASLKDKYQDRTEYPYTSRPNKNTNSGNLNTFMCQIEKLKRLMTGTDLDEGEEQVYANASEYPNIIIIEGGQNDAPDTDGVIDTYPDQFMTLVNNVYVAKNSDDIANAELGSIYLKTPTENVNVFVVLKRQNVILVFKQNHTLIA